MAKLIAKGKIKRAEREHEEELQKDAEKRADEMVKNMPSFKRGRQSNSSVTVKEISNVMADSMERLWEELSAASSFKDSQHMRLAAEHGAHYITGSLVYGLHGYGEPVKIREAEAKPRYCKEHRA